MSNARGMHFSNCSGEFFLGLYRWRQQTRHIWRGFNHRQGISYLDEKPDTQGRPKGIRKRSGKYFISWSITKATFFTLSNLLLNPFRVWTKTPKWKLFRTRVNSDSDLSAKLVWKLTLYLSNSPFFLLFSLSCSIWLLRNVKYVQMFE